MTFDELKNHIWDSANKLRGAVDPASYKDYILTLLFWKYISDLSDVERNKILEDNSTKDSDKEYIIRKNKYYLPEELHIGYIYDHKEDDNLGTLINDALTNISNYTRIYKGTIQDVDFNSSTKLGETYERNKLLKQLLTIFNSRDMKFNKENINSDLLGDVYQYLIGLFAAGAGKKGGEFYTPSQVSELLAKLVKPNEHDSIYDPTCGSGSLLIHAAKQVKGGRVSLFGQEKNSQT
ncbi:MAG: SAM-dependent DNA methyltransferase, partial [Mycoplasmataceae bacterium]|nr:SAM-dependent DNA methyltransferase [Mycoplasmataceae bacterium]